MPRMRSSTSRTSIGVLSRLSGSSRFWERHNPQPTEKNLRHLPGWFMVVSYSFASDLRVHQELTLIFHSVRIANTFRYAANDDSFDSLTLPTGRMKPTLK